ncbi:TonB-dependent receptor domain-containing protein [Rubritalea marina]|uniref:TonB-dependent receptor domain-containing protein n=1 Tax=Rubritalea marina TaxID=361055 RepID=UPI000370D7CF|nr:TonB-dependent receptor [Rubritalea marina]
MKLARPLTLLACTSAVLQAQTQKADENSTIVTANRFEQDRNDTSAAVSTFTAEDIERKQSRSLNELLRNEPNVEITGGNRLTGQQIEVRGQGGNAVTVRVDGAKQNFVTGHGGQRSFIDPFFLTSAELIRGPKSHLYGSGAAGVINLRTYSAFDLIDPGKGIGGKLQLGYQNVNEETSYGGLVAAGEGDLTILLGYINRNSKDIKLGNGLTSEGSAMDRESVLLKTEYSPNDEHSFSFGFNHYAADDQNGANPQIDVGTSSPLVNRETRYKQFSLSHSFSPADSELVDLQSTIYYNKTDQTRQYAETDPAASNFGRVNQQIFDTFGIDISNRSKYTAFGQENTLVSGFEFTHDTQEGRDTRADYSAGTPGTFYGRPNADADNVAAYIENWTNFENGFELAAGLRYDSFSSKSTSESQSNSELSPHLGARYNTEMGLSLFGDYARAFTAPTMNQLYQSGRHFAFSSPSFSGEGYFIANPDLKPEISDNFEIGADFKRELGPGFFDAKLSFFYQKGENTYDYDTETVMGFTPPFGPVTMTQYTQAVNREETTRKGLEFTTNYRTDLWYAKGTFSTMKAEDDSTGNKLNSTPGDKIYLETGYTVQDNFTFGINALFGGDRADKVQDDENKTSGYDIYGLFAQWQINQDLLLTAGVDNLLDQAYERSSVSNVEPGRNVYLAASYSF